MEDREQLQRVALGATAALVLGAIGPWATAFGIDKAGTEGDGVITLIGALVALALLRLWHRYTLAVVVAVIILFIGIYDFVDVSGTDLVSVGWGLYLTLVGGLALAYAALRLRTAGREAGEEHRTL